MADTPTGETVTPEAPSPDVTSPAAPAANAVDPAEVERLRKETEQKDLRIRQLENAEAARTKAEEERKAKELEDTQQFKTLYEQEKLAREAAESAREAETKKAELSSEAEKVFTDYSPEVKKLATTTGLTLTDTDETTVAAFKAKLDEIKSMVGGTKVTPNNPNASAPNGVALEGEDGMITSPLMQQPDKLDELFKSMPGISSMMSPKE